MGVIFAPDVFSFPGSCSLCNLAPSTAGGEMFFFLFVFNKLFVDQNQTCLLRKGEALVNPKKEKLT